MGGSIVLHVAAIVAVLLLASSLREPEQLFVDLTAGVMIGDERPPASSSGSRHEHAIPPTASRQKRSGGAPAMPVPPSSRPVELAPAPLPPPPPQAREPAADLPPSAPPSPAPDATAERGRSAPGAGPEGAGKGVTSDAPASPGQGAGPGGGSRFALAGPGAGRSEAPAEFGPYLASLRRRLQELVVYPLAARRQGLSGRVEVEVILESSGRVREVAVVASSSHALLDDAAVEAVRSLAPVPLPEGLPRRTLRVRLPIVFDLR
jgi:protein TonB